MKRFFKSNKLLAITLVIALFAIPLTISLVRSEQINRSQAASGTSLTFDPAAADDEPLVVTTGSDLTLTLDIEPGDTNAVTFVKYIIEYDPEIFSVTESDFVPNADAFPELLEGPTVADGKITASLSVGSDPAKSITEKTTLGEITFHAEGSTGDIPTAITYSADSEVLSIGQGDDIDENVLTVTGETIVEVTGETQEEPLEETSDTQTGDVTSVNILASLNGIGSAGDGVNPSNNSLSNKNPLTTSVPAVVGILDENGEDITRIEGNLEFDKNSGKFAGSFVSDTKVPQGSYILLILVDKYLPYEADIEITSDNGLDISDIILITGDIVPDGVLDILDYNALVDCGYGSGTPLAMTDPNSKFNSEACQGNEYAVNTDLDDNGVVDSRDFNLFLRELAAQSNKN